MPDRGRQPEPGHRATALHLGRDGQGPRQAHHGEARSARSHSSRRDRDPARDHPALESHCPAGASFAGWRPNTTIEGLSFRQKLPRVRSPNMQRLFSTFPDGRPGAGLLLLRGILGVWFVVVSGTYLAPVGQGGWWRMAVGLLAGASGASLLIGFLTPLGVLAGLVTIALAWCWPPLGSPVRLDEMLAVLSAVIAADAV